MLILHWMPIILQGKKGRKRKQNAYRTGPPVFELTGERSVGLSRQGEDKRFTERR